MFSSKKKKKDLNYNITKLLRLGNIANGVQNPFNSNLPFWATEVTK